jgi:ankyrin repeat protein
MSGYDNNNNYSNTIQNLFRAIRSGYTSDAERIIDSKEVDLNQVYDTQTALMYAVDHKRPAIVKMLIKAGADVNAQNSYGLTSMMYLLYTTNEMHNFENKFQRMFDDLLPKSDLTIQNDKGDTALFIALGNSKIDESIIKSLLDYGASIRHINNDGETVLFKFINRNNPDDEIEMLELLSRYITPEIINAKSKDGITALDLALALKNYKTAEHLLYKGAKVSNTIYSDIRSIEDETYYRRLMELVENQINKDDVLPPMRPTDLQVRFGVELEICVKLTEECGHDTNMEQNNIENEYWIDLFGMYAKSMLSKSPLAEKMRKRYKYMYVSDGEKYGVDYILNLTTFEIEETENTVIAYDKPFFTLDTSVVCGDYEQTPNRRNSYMPNIKNTFHMEMVSPIMTTLDELKDLLEFVGMQKPCFVSNDTAGFHVNVSLLNKNTNKTIPLTIDFFTRTFFPRYKVWEAEVYPKVRPQIDMPYAKCIGGKDASLYPELYHEICKSKYVSLHRKNHELVEFRLFGSSSNLSDLLHYTQMATELMRNCYLEWYAIYKPSLALAPAPTLRGTSKQMLHKQVQLQRSLQKVKAQLRTRRTKGLLTKRNSIQRSLRRLTTLRGKNAFKRQSILTRKSLTTHKTRSKATSKGKSKTSKRKMDL